MTTIYIKESKNDEELIVNEKIPKFIKKIVIKIKKKVNIIIRKQIENNYIYIIPNINNKNVQKRLEKKLSKEEKDIQIVLSNKIKKLDLKLDKIKIVDGKKIQKYLIGEILKYIIDAMEDKEIKLEFQDIYILQKEHNFETISMIEYLLTKVKTINIVTNAIEKYKKLEENLYNIGYLITVSNNKKKSLKKAKIILNMDFLKEELSNYTINRNAIIINLTKEKINNLKSFDGIIVNEVQIEMKEELRKYFIEKNIYDEFSNIDLYESTCNSEKFENQIRKIEENEVKVVKLLGNNGKISEKELILKKMFLTNAKI